MLQKLGGGTPKGRVMLLAFYNTKALGVRYLEGALERAGYQVQVVFYKEFNSHCPGQTSRRELELLCEEVRRAEPVFIGLSVMSSMYLDTVEQVMKTLRARYAIPLVCGGAFASLYQLPKSLSAWKPPSERRRIPIWATLFLTRTLPSPPRPHPLPC